MIPQSFIHDLLSRVNIVDAIDRYVPLKKSGTNYVACCPFHSEKTPSFSVSSTKQFYHCFGCGAHGDAINFLVEYSGLSFVEAVQELATSVGMQVPEQQSDVHSNNARASNHKWKDNAYTLQDLLKLMQRATQFYRERLKHSQKAIDYLKLRGLSGKTAARFGLGYAPEDWHNLSTLFTDYQSERTKKELMRVGLVISSENGRQYDRFRDRIMFPILNLKGQIIAFGGRVIDRGEPKYLNSPETDLFVKGQEVYHLYSARKAIRDAGCAVVVEGYMDVAVLFEHGIEYAVATLGTAITAVHVQKLLRQTDKIVFCFDGDSAGKKAAWRALESSLEQLVDGKAIYFLFLPEGEDPDSFVRQQGKEVFEQHIARALPLSEFLLMELTRNQNLETDENRAKLIQDAKALLQRIKAPALLFILIKRLSELSRLNQHELEALLQIKNSVPPVRAPKSITRKQPVSPYRWLLSVLLYKPQYLSELDKSVLELNDENNEELSALKFLVEFLDARPDIVTGESMVSILTYFQDSPFRALFEKVESDMLSWDNGMDLKAEFSGAVNKLQEIQRKKRMQELHNKPLALLTEEEKRELKHLAAH